MLNITQILSTLLLGTGNLRVTFQASTVIATFTMRSSVALITIMMIIGGRIVINISSMMTLTNHYQGFFGFGMENHMEQQWKLVLFSSFKGCLPVSCPTDVSGISNRPQNYKL